MKNCNDITFLNDYWKEAKNIAIKIKVELPLGLTDSKSLKFIKNNSGIKMFTINYSDLGNSWSVEDVLLNIAGKSKTLEILADKISDMIYKNRAGDIKPMIEKICTGRIKSLSHISKNSKKEKKLSTSYHNYYHGKGHFRWNYEAHTLNELEIKHLKKYFNL